MTTTMSKRHPSVQVVAVTKPLVEGVSDAAEFIAFAARVSNPANQKNLETAPKLLDYLIRNQHWSPFEMVSLTMEINTTRDIARQILRHRSFAFQEFSQRYAVVTGLVEKECRMQHPTNRQASEECASAETKNWWKAAQDSLGDHAMCLYNTALARGIAKEQARALLPEGLTESTLYMAGTLRSWIHYIQLRTEIGTQKEHREIAELCAKSIAEHFPQLRDFLK